MAWYLAKGAVKVAERCLPNQGPFIGIDGVVDIEGHLGKGGVRLGDEVRVESLAVVTTDTLVHGAVHDLVREGLHLVWGKPEGEFTIHCSFSELAFAGSVNLNYCTSEPCAGYPAKRSNAPSSRLRGPWRAQEGFQ